MGQGGGVEGGNYSEMSMLRREMWCFSMYYHIKVVMYIKRDMGTEELVSFESH
jgi:hypothetical protein